jgi:hypothetical protein
MANLNDRFVYDENKLNITKEIIDKIIIIEYKIKEIDNSIKELERQYDENKLILDSLEPKVGHKRSRFYIEN